MTAGTDPHIVLGEEMLHPRDGSEKDEGEQTGGKRLIERLYSRHHHFADVIAGDALYLNAPFIETVTEKGIDVVIRSKDPRRLIMQDALGLIKGKESDTSFTEGKVKAEVWDIKLSLMETGVCGRIASIYIPAIPHIMGSSGKEANETITNYEKTVSKR